MSTHSGAAVVLMVWDLEWTGDEVDAPSLVAARLSVPVSDLKSVTLVKKSLDARKGRPRWKGVFRVEVPDDTKALRRQPRSVRLWTDRDEDRYGFGDRSPKPLRWPADVRPVVIGAGPAGLFAALWLAEAGASVTLVERGGRVDSRVEAVNSHWRGKAALDPENNLVFGEGGAGTFSDGKIYTRRRDGELGYVFRRLVEFGADPTILSEGWAHLGTDKIRALLVPFRQRLESLGVELRFGVAVTELVVRGGRCVGVRLADGTELLRAPVFWAAGHSARDSAAMLLAAGARASLRSLAIGARIEHPQAWVDRTQYHRDARGELPAASYRLAHNPSRGLPGRTFCMCPGGMVVPAANQPGRVVVNGMSFAARRAAWANSAVIVEVPASELAGGPGSGPMSGYEWQDRIEVAAFAAGGGDGKAPAQRVVDLLASKPSSELPRTSYPLGVTASDLREVLPPMVIAGLIDTLRAFDATMPGFAGPDAVLIAPETRTTSPLKFERGDDLASTTLPGLYPVGEGAGHAGGIVTSALDGLRAARSLAASVGASGPK